LNEKGVEYLTNAHQHSLLDQRRAKLVANISKGRSYQTLCHFEVQEYRNQILKLLVHQESHVVALLKGLAHNCKNHKTDFDDIFLLSKMELELGNDGVDILLAFKVCLLNDSLKHIQGKVYDKCFHPVDILRYGLQHLCSYCFYNFRLKCAAAVVCEIHEFLRVVCNFFAFRLCDFQRRQEDLNEYFKTALHHEIGVFLL